MANFEDPNEILMSEDSINGTVQKKPDQNPM